MTTLNARANQAYNDLIEDWNREHPDWEWMGFDHQRDAFESGWETGYKTARQEEAARVNEVVEYLRARGADEAVGTADTRWAYKRAADYIAGEVGGVTTDE